MLPQDEWQHWGHPKEAFRKFIAAGGVKVEGLGGLFVARQH
jgi:hypothetical protein